jgi:hypothetical protein
VRPVWWMLRGWAIWVIVMTVTSGGHAITGYGRYSGGDDRFLLSPASLLVLGVCLVLSVQWGRGRWLPWRWTRAVLLAGSVIVAIALPFLLGWAVTALNNSVWDAQALSTAESKPTDGLREGGYQVTNVFAYDKDGQPIEQVRLYDQNGRQLRVVDDPTTPYWTLQDGSAVVPGTNASKGSGWNIYPLQHVAARDVETGHLAKGAVRRDVDAPFVNIPPLATPTPATPGNVPTPSPIPTAGPTPTASPNPTDGATPPAGG